MSRRALIVGGGVAGLAAAWWLAEAGWQPLVVERAPDLRADGYMLSVSGPGYEAARRMGLLPALSQRACSIHENIILGRDGRDVLRLRYRDFLRGLDYLTLSRTELVETLHAAARERAEIRFGVTLADLLPGRDGVEVSLSDGSALAAELVIGADGVHSALRGRVFGPESDFARPLGYRAAAFQMPNSLGLERDFLSFGEAGRIVEFYKLSAERLAGLYLWRSDDRRPVAPAERLAALRAAFDGAHPDALAPFEALDEGAGIYFDSLTMIDMPAWSRGRVLLLGDAAHCLTLISGQGAGMAMASACLLASLLKKGGDLESVLAGHQAALYPAIQRLQQRSRRMAAWFIPATERGFRLRNGILRHIPRRLLGWYFLRAVRSEILAAEAPLS